MPLHTRCGYIFTYPQPRIAISKVDLGILSIMGNLSKQQSTHSTQYTHNTQLNLTTKTLFKLFALRFFKTYKTLRT